MPNIIKQDGSPVDDEPKSEEDGELYEGVEALTEAAKELGAEFEKGVKSVKKFRDGFLFKIGVIAVAIKTIDVVGKIIIEDRQLKAKKQQDEE